MTGKKGFSTAAGLLEFTGVDPDPRAVAWSLAETEEERDRCGLPLAVADKERSLELGVAGATTASPEMWDEIARTVRHRMKEPFPQSEREKARSRFISLGYTEEQFDRVLSMRDRPPSRGGG